MRKTKYSYQTRSAVQRQNTRCYNFRRLKNRPKMNIGGFSFGRQRYPVFASTSHPRTEISTSYRKAGFQKYSVRGCLLPRAFGLQPCSAPMFLLEVASLWGFHANCEFAQRKTALLRSAVVKHVSYVRLQDDSKLQRMTRS